MTKKEISKMSVREVLFLIYTNQIIENSLSDLPKDELVNFILEVFNKGILKDYLKLD